MKKLLLVLIFAASAAIASTPEGWTDDYDEALKRAKDEGKVILADFTGSDWCGWCKKLDREVFSTEVFRRQAPEKYVLLYIDSPGAKSELSEKARRENPKLVRQYSISGFPTVLMLDSSGKTIAKLGYRQGGPEAYLKYVEEALAQAPEIEKYIKPIEDLLRGAEDAMRKEMESIQKEIWCSFTNETSRLSDDDERKKKASGEFAGKMEEAFFGKVLPKHFPLMSAALDKAKAVEVPEKFAEKKNKLIVRFETMLEKMKQANEKKRQKKDQGEQ